VRIGHEKSHFSNVTAILGSVGVCCALLGLLAWIEYGSFATRAINASFSGEKASAYRMASYADGFHIAQLLLGVLSVGLGWIARARGGDSRLARRLGFSAICLGVAVLALMLLLV
jgi:hypothetical protein